MFNPVSTYRIQFHKGFSFDDFERVVPYLEKLGVKTIYASPIFRAVPGSMHGYDSVNPLEINPEIGTIEQLRKISRQLQEKGIGWVQDIVPNHMAYYKDNRWLMDVLEKGALSKYKAFFDQSLTSDLFNGPIMVPFLGTDLDEAIQNNEVKIAWQHQQMVFEYYQQTWPLNLNAYATILSTIADLPVALIRLTEDIKIIQKIDDADAFTFAMNEWKLQLGALIKDVDVNNYLKKCLSAVNDDKSALLHICYQQYYRLCSWKETDHKINFRRFFTVNSLICLNIQEEEVFTEFHQLIISLIRDNTFKGLRIDHIDGLYDPEAYLNSLRKLVGEDVYIVVEKILGSHEKLADWNIQGTTGYDFLAQVNNLFTNRHSEEEFTRFYEQLTDNKKPVQEQIFDKKAYILHNHMAGELDNLTDLFIRLDKIKVEREELKQAISAFLIHFPVYRFYGNSFPLKDKESAEISKILSGIKEEHKKLTDAVKLLEDALLGNHKNNKWLDFYMRCMQFTGPLMAKGVEDTLMYTYERFIVHNEVGDTPGAFGISAGLFHEKMKERQQEWPLTMNSTATHDTKRGEDIRARINVLSDMPEEWLQAVITWRKMNFKLKQIGAPDANDEYNIYQALIGSYPMPGEQDEKFSERLQAYLEKSMREAKINSDWATPNEEYETAVKQFFVALLDKQKPFWKSFTELHHKVADFGIVNSLAQVLLKFTCPGVPDIYQGAEYWDLSLVDPDNRRPVDYTLHNSLLSKAESSSVITLWQNRFNGQIKTWLVRQLLHERKQNPLLFAEADYFPLEVKGKYADHIFAFARCCHLSWYVVVIPLNMARLCIIQGKGSPDPDWEDTKVILPGSAPEKFKDILNGTSGTFKKEIFVKELFETIPLALLKLSHADSGRVSGILMAISSLPSPFGIGDLGTGAIQFADMLHKCYQRYWQLLPIGPVNAKSSYSPYSSCSSMAGNILFISPDLLLHDGLFKQDDLEKHQLPVFDEVDYKAAGKIKQLLFEVAWSNFKDDKFGFLRELYDEFCKKEAAWLHDYALYTVLKQQHKDKPWYLWPDALKLRNKEALADFSLKNQDAIEMEKWLQFVFDRQWQQLKNYCRNLNIKLLGDLPFYVSYDSADVWTCPEIFSLDEQGNMEYVAGVPPDYFNADGQLWGMPVFRWDILKSKNYDWWILRIRRNLELFDLLRLDHFRAFAAYWAVPNGENTARNGSWIEGPGSDFFKSLKNELGTLPFVAEDLGDIDDPVYQLRDEFELPGMRVLQFAFNNGMSLSPHLPHNYIVHCVAYTGTHDNNTIKGWYREEAGKAVRKNIKAYTGLSIKEKHINYIFIRLVMASVAQTAIIPLQDLLGLNESARMNIPAAAEGNWLWRLTSTCLPSKVQKKLVKWTKMYNRISE